jgi:Thiopurine S-methyltransferase (TPMT)
MTRLDLNALARALKSLVSASPTNVVHAPLRLRSLAVAERGFHRCAACCAEHSRNAQPPVGRVSLRRYAAGGSNGGDSQGEKTSGAAVRVMQERFANKVLGQQQQQQRPEEFPSAGAESLWESLWKDNITPWDLGGPTPALFSELDRVYPTDGGPSADRSFYESNRTVRVLVPGCGAGYDLTTLHVHFRRVVEVGRIRRATIVGLDLSPTSLSRASEVLDEFFVTMPRTTSTRVLLVHGDYFEPTTKWKVRSTYGGTNVEGKDEGDNDTALVPSEFDLLFDYTFFCALPPLARELWGLRTSQLLHLSEESSRILTLMFPVLEDSSNVQGMDPTARLKKMRGPPFPVVPFDYQAVLEPHGIFMESDPYASPDTDPTRVGMELVCWWKWRRSTSSTRRKTNDHCTPIR